VAIEKDYVRSVERAFDILEVFADDKSVLALNDISRKLKMANTTAFRLLQTLEKRGFVFKDSRGMYHLGLAILGLHNVLMKSLDLRAQALPFMRDLRNQAEETVNLFILRNMRRVCVESVDGPFQLKYSASIGDVLPLHIGASGKIILANQSASYIDDYLQNVAKDPLMKQIEDQDAFVRSLAQISNQGCSYSHGEREAGLCSISAPIRNHEGQVIAAITISGPEIRIYGERIQKLADLVMGVALDISRTIGHQSNCEGRSSAGKKLSDITGNTRATNKGRNENEANYR